MVRSTSKTTLGIRLSANALPCSSAQADNETEHAPNVEELFGSEEEDDDYNPSLDVGEEQPEAAPQSKHERMQALANRKRREQVQPGNNMRTTHMDMLAANRRLKPRKQPAASDAAPRRRSTKRPTSIPRTCLGKKTTRTRPQHPSTRSLTGRGRSQTPTATLLMTRVCEVLASSP